MTVDLTTPTSVHLVGIGGSGMSGLAMILHAMNHEVSGSDVVDSGVVQNLVSLGITVAVPHGDLPKRAVIVSRSSAISDDNVELLQAVERGLEVLSRADLLSSIAAQRATLAVAGTHGKSTTTAMLATILLAADRDPSWLVGGSAPSLGQSAHWGSGPDFVLEADESDGTFLRLNASGGIVTSVEADHLDYYGSLEALQSAFRTFLTSIDGPRVVCADDPGAFSLVGIGKVITYGLSDGADVRATDVHPGPFDITAVVHAGGKTARLELAVPGEHNLRNALGAIALSLARDVEVGQACEALASFRQVGRRFERKGQVRGAVIVDDYAHLPGEISAILHAARQGGWHRVLAVFQPHRYSRTAALWREFADAFVEADELILTDVYGAGELPIPGVDGHLLVRSVLDAHRYARVAYFPKRESLATYVGSHIRSGDLVLTMGAGDISSLGDELGAQ